MASFSRQSFGLVMWLVPATAMAAPFCVQTQAISPQCIFFDAASCNKRAKELGGTCTVDTSQITVSSGVGHYCLLTSSMSFRTASTPIPSSAIARRFTSRGSASRHRTGPKAPALIHTVKSARQWPAVSQGTMTRPGSIDGND